ncbi:deoxyguanosinetriphosphate triphosphohydrolase [Patescibacteria group bacterium]|nr:deoxyguanosinetriphosphate triphosphohydrolase [Patescibacteria group bacterium]
MIYSLSELEENEAKVLAPYAVLSRESKGRKYGEAHDLQRMTFQKDRDRIIHSRAFRRLKSKTQVFVPHYGDHYRNRLSHSLEVSQIARDTARNLGLNEDLAEAISLAHDLGHTPFGHAGEATLDEELRAYGMSFEHNEQSRRVVEELENVYPAHPGLNLSVEVVEGLMKHETSWDNPAGAAAVRPSLEAQVVNLADEIAYQNHDVDDGLRSGLFLESDLRGLAVWRMAEDETKERYGDIKDDKVRFARTVSKMIGLMITDVCVETGIRLDEKGIRSLDDVYECVDRLVTFSEQMGEANKQLKDFLLKNLYFHPDVMSNMERGQVVIKSLFQHFMKLPQDLPPLIALKTRELGEMDRAELVRDYLAGMTDRFAWLQAEQLGLQ